MSSKKRKTLDFYRNLSKRQRSKRKRSRYRSMSGENVEQEKCDLYLFIHFLQHVNFGCNFLRSIWSMFPNRGWDEFFLFQLSSTTQNRSYSKFKRSFSLSRFGDVQMVCPTGGTSLWPDLSSGIGRLQIFFVVVYYPIKKNSTKVAWKNVINNSLLVNSNNPLQVKSTDDAFLFCFHLLVSVP